jgi:peptidoglycan/xylan/chitin deacetylase (PgdA/CDA1 family)
MMFTERPPMFASSSTRDVLAVCYHAVSETWPASMAVPASRLEAQVASLLERGYSPVTFTQALEDDSFERVLAVTFDDGYRSVVEQALPVLSSLGVPATVFVAASFVGGDRPMSWPGIDHWLGTEHEYELLPMTWEELGRLRDEGWEIGSHTNSHPRLTRLDDADLVGELGSSRRLIEENLEAPCTSVAYPFGDVDRRVADAARSAGYRAGAGLAAHELRANPMRWPRVTAYREDSLGRFRFKASKLARRASLARLRHPLTKA